MRLVALKHLLKKWPAKPKALNVQVLFWTMCDHNMLLCNALHVLFCQSTRKRLGIQESFVYACKCSEKAVYLHGYGHGTQSVSCEVSSDVNLNQDFKPTSEHIHIDSCF